MCSRCAFPFRSDDTYSIDKWIADLEEMPEVYAWTEMKEFIYGKWLLIGTALLFVRTASGIKVCRTLRDWLETEFRSRLSTADIHKQLATKAKKLDEIFMLYLDEGTN